MIRVRATSAVILAMLLLAAASLTAQERDPGEATLRSIHASAEFRPERFGPAEWLDEGAYTTVEPSEAVEGARELVRYDAATGERRVLVSAADLIPEGADEPIAIEEYDRSPDGRRLLIFTNSKRVWRDNTRGDYWVLDEEEGSLRRLGGEAPESTLMFAKFSPDGDRVGYVRYDENDIYVEDLDSGRIEPITTDGTRTVINGTFDWVYEEELGLQDGWRWSPDGERIAYWQLDAEGVRDFLLINNTDSLYSFTIPIQYPKAGTTNSAARIGIVPSSGGETTWLALEGDPRQHYPARMEWAAGSDEVVVRYLNRLQNRMEILLGDVETGRVRTIMIDEDPDAWIDLRVDPLVWMEDGAVFAWTSERTGWRRAYVVSRDGTEIRGVTPDSVDVIEVEAIEPAEGWIYYVASPDDPARRALWRARLDGSGSPERLTPADEPGTHDYTLAPGGRFAFRTHHRFGVPPVTDLVRLPDHAVVRTLVDNEELAGKVTGLERGPYEFFTVDADGVEVHGWMMKPPGFDPGKRYPIVFYVYGEPAGQTVRDAWGGSRYLWHVHLTQRGYLVASVDPRGSAAPKGTEWRKTIYRRIGTLTSRDIAAAAGEILAWPYVDEDRVAIWGWSGGGSQTLNAMFRHPEIFHVGMAIAPVPDIHLYDTIYQERYMGLPADHPEEWRESSPITHAAGLEGDLLVAHGTGDDNVHYQGTERLVDALIAENKRFTMMAYPNRTHGISEGKNTRLHLFSLMTRFLLDHLPPRPAETASAR